MGRKWPDAQRSEHKALRSVIWSRAQGAQEGWCCGPVEFHCYTAVHLPMHLCSILSRQHPRAYQRRAETRARLSSPVPCRHNVLTIKEIHSYSAKAGNGNPVKQPAISACALCITAAFLLFPFLLPCCSPSPKEMLGLHFVCAGSSASAFRERYFPGLRLPKHFPGTCLPLRGPRQRTRRLVWSAAVVFVAVIELLSCLWQNVHEEGFLAGDVRQV